MNNYQIVETMMANETSFAPSEQIDIELFELLAKWFVSNWKNEKLSKFTRSEIGRILTRHQVDTGICPIMAHWLTLGRKQKLYYYAIELHGIIDNDRVADKLFWLGVVEIIGVSDRKAVMGGKFEKFRHAMFEEPKRNGGQIRISTVVDFD